VSLRCSDGTVEIPRDACKLSRVLAEMADDDSTELPVGAVSTAAMSKVAEFLKHHATHPLPRFVQPVPSSDVKDALPDQPWDVDFINGIVRARAPNAALRLRRTVLTARGTQEQRRLFEVVEAAKYLDVESLTNLCACKFATMLRGRTPDQVRDAFRIRHPTAEEEKQILERSDWVRRPSSRPARGSARRTHVPAAQIYKDRRRAATATATAPPTTRRT